MWRLYVIFIIAIFHTGVYTNTNYGPYTLSWDKMDTCKGPKQADCGSVLIDNLQNISDVIFRLDFPKDCQPTAARIQVSTLHSNNTQSKLWNYALNKPCQHFILGPILTGLLNATNDCKIRKGLHEVHVNMREQSRNFLGSNFFYGTFSFKVFAYNKNTNFFCVNIVIIVAKIS